MSTLSASGARIRGDDYQHLFAWIQAMRAVQPGRGVSAIGIEDPEAGSGDGRKGTKLTLITNRPPAADDPVISLRDGRDGTVSARLREASPRSKAGIARRTLAQHLNTTEARLLEFLADMSLRASRLYEE